MLQWENIGGNRVAMGNKNISPPIHRDRPELRFPLLGDILYIGSVSVMMVYSDRRAKAKMYTMQSIYKTSMADNTASSILYDDCYFLKYEGIPGCIQFFFSEVNN